jgi:hypothetical protein
LTGEQTAQGGETSVFVSRIPNWPQTVSNLYAVTIPRLAATFLMGWSGLAAGQLSGQFYLEKSTFAPGEPIFLYFQVVNNGPQAESLDSADPYSLFLLFGLPDQRIE